MADAGSDPSPPPPLPPTSSSSSAHPPHSARTSSSARPPAPSKRASGFSLSLPPPTPSVAASSSAVNPFDMLGGGGGGGSAGSTSTPTPHGAFPPQQPAANPWAHLMANSGAPTPSLKGMIFSPFAQYAPSDNGGGGGGSNGSSSSASSSGRAPAPGGVMSPDVKGMREMSLSSSSAAAAAAAATPQMPCTSPESAFPGFAAALSLKHPPGRQQAPPPPPTPGFAMHLPPSSSAPGLKLPLMASMPGAAGSRVPSGPVGGGGRPVFGSAGPSKAGTPTNASGGASPASSSPAGSAAGAPSSGMSSGGPAIRLILPSAIPTPIPPTYLLLDLRTHALFTASRIPSAIPVTIPSTLLRRPNFTLGKLIPMLDSETDRARVLAFKDNQGPGKIDAVVVYDQDGSSAGENGTLVGLLAKFRKDGFQGELLAVKGGFLNVLKHHRATGGQAALVDEKRIETSFKAGGTINGRELPMTAFQSTSTATSLMSPANQNAANLPNNASFAPGVACSCPPGGQHLPQAHTGANGGFQPHGHGASDSSNPAAGLKGFAFTPNTSSMQAANPFFDNIRQNVELSHGGITERIPLDLPQSTVARAHELPDWLRELALCGEKDAAERLAAQFEAVERGELKRLQGVMSYHAKFGGNAASTEPGGGAGGAEGEGEYFPYSIIAGLEKGQKNRFRNIWPFDHARVRLADHCEDDGSDYINASYVQPRATHKRYIATQGPLPSTYRDFWTVCWEQNVRVIVMLTKQHEGGQIKCGDYWSDESFGPLKLHPIGVEGDEDEAEGGSDGGFFFSAPPPSAKARTPSSRSSSFSSTASSRPSLIKRSFHLSHADFPNEPDRLITQLQYVSWPDFDIPDSPADLLSLIHQVNDLNDSAAAEAAESGRAPPGPTVVHCSAGVGRTGSYVVVDAVLDAVKREMAGRRESRKARSRTFSTASSVGGSGVATPVGGAAAAANQQQQQQSDTLRPSAFGAFPAASPRSTPGSASPVPPPTPPQNRRQPQPSSPLRVGESSPVHAPSNLNLERRPSMDQQPPPVPSGMEVDFSKVIEDKARSSFSFGQPRADESAMSDTSYDQADGSSNAAVGSAKGGISIPRAIPSPSISSAHNGSQASLGQFGEMNLASPLGGDSRRGSVPHIHAVPSGSHGAAHSPNYSRESSPAGPPTLPESDVPRNQQRSEERGSPSDLAELKAPIFSILADLRQQRMSLCQTLRQYVFVYRAVFQGVLDIIDEEKKGVSDLHTDDKKRQASPTNIKQNLSKRPSLKLPKSHGRPRRGSNKAMNNGTSALPSIPSPVAPSGLSGPSSLPSDSVNGGPSSASPGPATEQDVDQPMT